MIHGPWGAIGAREHLQTRTTFCFVALDAERTGIIVRNKTMILGMYLIISVSNVTGCHIPPLDDKELIALLRATNDNDVDNGLSSWIGKCCKRKRVQKQATPEVGIIDRTLRGVTSVQGIERPPFAQLLLYLSWR